VLRRCAGLLGALFLVWSGALTPSHAADLLIEAPPALDASKQRVEDVDLSDVARALERAGLALPQSMRITLVPENDPGAREIPPWVVGLAFGDADIVLFPQRVRPYPYDSLESVLRHEITHLALTARAGGEVLPRWFHEGVAMAVDGDWGIGGQFRLLFEMARNPGTAQLTQLFDARTQPDSALAYAMSAALIADMQRRHGADVPGRIAARVAAGAPFIAAVELETGETPDEAATRAWRLYRRWTNWVPALTSGSAIWVAIMAVAGVAYVAVRRRRARRRAQWEAEEAEWAARWEEDAEAEDAENAEDGAHAERAEERRRAEDL
jgi:hypothetical protein